MLRVSSVGSCLEPIPTSIDLCYHLYPLAEPVHYIPSSTSVSTARSHSTSPQHTVNPPTMPLLMSRGKSPDAAESSSASSFRSRSNASTSSSCRSNGGRSSQKAAELRARYEMAQAIQKPWPLHLLENGVKPNAAGSSASSTTREPYRSTRSATSSSSAKQTSSSSTRSSSSSSRRERASVSATHAELTVPDMDAASRSSSKKRNSTSSLDKLSLSPTLSNWIRRASRDSDKSSSSTDNSSSRDASSPVSSSNTSPMYSPKDL